MRVLVYGSNGCIECQKIKEELDAAEVSYGFKDVDLTPFALLHVQETQGCSPLVEIESGSGARVVVGGFKETKESLDLIRFIIKEV